MNWNEFFKSDEFRSYRKHQIEQVGMYVEQKSRAMIAGSDPTSARDKLRGAMDMARLYINMPENMTDSEELKDVLSIQKQEDYAALAKFLVMRHMI